MYTDINEDFDVIWKALWAYQDALNPDGETDENHNPKSGIDVSWAEICEAMAHLREVTGIPDPDMEVDD